MDSELTLDLTGSFPVVKKRLPDGRVASAYGLTFGRGRIAVGPDEITVTDNW